jgi:glutamate-1-semialdehyde 2,1-aminomutase
MPTLQAPKVDQRRSYARSQAHQLRAHQIIPGAAHTYAKGDDQFPEGMCPVIARGAGARVWDIDGNEFIEYGAGVRSITLGHGYKPVCDAAYKAMLDGTNFVRPAKIELEAAERMLSCITRADMVKFGKNGSDAVSGAVKIARAYTGREMVAICGDHPFFSVDDWFMGTTAMNGGIPEYAKRQTVKFKYNDLPSVQALFDQYPNQIACVILEAETVERPRPNYLHDLQDLAHENGAILILDETVTGFRWHIGGAQQTYDFTPDLSTFGKGMANGFSVAALCGKREYMRLAGIEHADRERCFVLSLTHGAETSGLAACIATIDAYREIDACGIMDRQGQKLQSGLRQAIESAGVSDYFQIMGRPWLTFYATLDATKQRSQPFRTLFLQEIMKRGVIAPSFAIGAAHSDADVQQTVDAVADALVVYRQAIEEGVEKHLVGRPVQPVFRKFN